MNKKLAISLAALLVAFVGTTFAAVEGIKVSGDITSQAVTRDFSMNGTTSVDQEDFLFSQIRLRFDADLTEGVSAVLSLIDERLWDAETNASTDIDLDLAYVELKEFLHERLTLTAGRQYLRYGNALIIGDPDTNMIGSSAVNAKFGDLSLRKAFDAVRAVFDYAPYTLDLIYAKASEGTTNVLDDRNIWGGNLGYEWDSYNGLSEVYFFGAQGRTGGQVLENEDKTYVLGTRTQLDVSDNFTLGAECAYQFGDYITGVAASAGRDTLDRQAWAGQLISEYRFLNDYNTRVGLALTYLSGSDNRSGDGDYEAWDSLFEDQNPGEILNIVAAQSNAQFVTVTSSFMPREDITLGLLYTHARFAETRTNANLTAAGAAAGNVYAINTNEKEIGDELDVYALYDYTEDVQLSLMSAFFFPGDYLQKSNDGIAYSVRGGLTVNF